VTTETTTTERGPGYSSPYALPPKPIDEPNPV
jgi:hypothetical protein